MAKTKGKSPKGKTPAAAPVRTAAPGKGKAPAKAAGLARSAMPGNGAPSTRSATAASVRGGVPAKAGAGAGKGGLVTVAPAIPARPTQILKAKIVKTKGGREIVRAIKPAKATKPSLPAPPPPPKPVEAPVRDELLAPRDVARLTRYGERFGAHKIDVRWLPVTLPVANSSLAILDPGAGKSVRVFDRTVGAGQFRTMLSIARSEDGKERLAAIVIHVGRPPITRWTVAHYRGQKKPKSADQLPRVVVTTGWLALIDAGKDPGKDTPGTIAVPQSPPPGIQPVELPLTDGRKALALRCPSGEYAAYWAVDATDKPICLVVDFDVFTQKDWKSRPPA